MLPNKNSRKLYISKINGYKIYDWQSILQTSTFPEHTSGHSVTSSTAATVLTEIFGDNYTFIDATEVHTGFLLEVINLLIKQKQRQLADYMGEFIVNQQLN